LHLLEGATTLRSPVGRIDPLVSTDDNRPSFGKHQLRPERSCQAETPGILGSSSRSDPGRSAVGNASMGVGPTRTSSHLAIAEKKLEPESGAQSRSCSDPGETLADASTWADENGDGCENSTLALR